MTTYAVLIECFDKVWYIKVRKHYIILTWTIWSQGKVPHVPNLPGARPYTGFQRTPGLGSTRGVISTPHVCYINPVILIIICLWHFYNRSDELSSRITDKTKHYGTFVPIVYPTNDAPGSAVLCLGFMGWFDFYTHVLPQSSNWYLLSHPR